MGIMHEVKRLSGGKPGLANIYYHGEDRPYTRDEAREVASVIAEEAGVGVKEGSRDCWHWFDVFCHGGPDVTVFFTEGEADDGTE